MGLDVVENRWSPDLAIQSFHPAHASSDHAFCLGDCLARPITQGRRLKGCAEKGSARLCAGLRAAMVPSELSAQPLALHLNPLDKKEKLLGFCTSWPEQRIWHLD